MKKFDIKKLYTPFLGSPAHVVCVVLGALILAAGLIFSAHLIMHNTAVDTAAVCTIESEAIR